MKKIILGALMLLITLLSVGCGNDIPMTIYGNADTAKAKRLVRNLEDIHDGEGIYTPERADICDYDGAGVAEALVFFGETSGNVPGCQLYVNLYSSDGELLWHDDYISELYFHGDIFTVCYDGRYFIANEFSNTGVCLIEEVYPENQTLGHCYGIDENLTAELFGEETESDDYFNFVKVEGV